MLKTMIKKASRNRILNFKVTTWEDERIESFSNEFTGGNKSEWIRFASLNFRPKKKHLIPVDEKEPDGPKAICFDKSAI